MKHSRTCREIHDVRGVKLQNTRPSGVARAGTALSQFSRGVQSQEYSRNSLKEVLRNGRSCLHVHLLEGCSSDRQKIHVSSVDPPKTVHCGDRRNGLAAPAAPSGAQGHGATAFVSEDSVGGSLRLIASPGAQRKCLV